MRNQTTKTVTAGVAVSLAVGAVALLSGCQEDVTTRTAVLSQYQTATADLATSTRALSESIAQICQAPSEERLAQAQHNWQQAFLNWMPLQGREKGSEAALALSWQIQFWPDKKNTTGRKLTQLLKQDTTWTPEAMAEQSVAVQGFGAMEWFLFDQSDALQQAEGCQLAHAVSLRLADSAGQLQSAWQADPWQEMTPQMALGEYLGALNNQMDYTIKKLTRPMGKPGSPKPYQAEAWRAQYSLSSLKASVAAMQALYLADGKGIDAMLRERGFADTATRISQRFEYLLSGWPASEAMVPLLTSRDGYRELINIYNGLEYIQIALHDEVAPELGVVVGFNATDGD